MTALLLLASFCYGPGLMPIHGHCYRQPEHAYLRIRLPQCQVTLEYEHAKLNGREFTQQFNVLHDDGACVRPMQFVLGGGPGLMKIQHEDLAWQATQVERIVETR